MNVFKKETIRELRNRCRQIYLQLRESMKITRKICLLPLYIPFSEINGLTVTIGAKNKSVDLIIVNLRPYQNSHNQTLAMTSFFLHSVIAHELKHIQLMEEWYSGRTNEFSILFSEWAQKHICKGILRIQPIRSYLALKGASTLRKQRYAVSPIELICYRYGFQEAFNQQSSFLNAKEVEIAKTILESIEFINQHLEIDYYNTKQAYNRFTHSLHLLNQAVKRRPKQLSAYPQLYCIFTPDGLIKSPIQVFSERTESNRDLIDQILIRMFITLSFDWDTIFQAEKKLFHHICILANQYCAETIHYLKHMVIGEVFLSKSVLQDNAAMLIKNTATLNNLMNTYHIPHTTGSVLPLYYSDEFTKPQ